jgi:hypothetical protein
MIIGFNHEARLRNNYKAPCMACHGLLQYVTDMSTGGLGSLTAKILKDGEKTTISDDPCKRAHLALEWYIGLNKGPEAKEASEYYINFPYQPYGNSCKSPPIKIHADKGD